METNDKQLPRKYVHKRNELVIKLCRYLYFNRYGGEISLKYRKDNYINNDSSLTYGEVVPQSFLSILSITNTSYDTNQIRKEKVFVDLGSGTGRACITAALSSYQFTKVIGIELIPSLHNEALDVLKTLNNLLDKSNSDNNTLQQFKTITDTNNNDSIKRNNSISKQSNINFDEVIIKFILSNENKIISVEHLANSLCKSIGHKTFKANIKETKTFVKYLKANSSLYEFTNINDKYITLSQQQKQKQQQLLSNNIVSFETLLVSDADFVDCIDSLNDKSDSDIISYHNNSNNNNDSINTSNINSNDSNKNIDILIDTTSDDILNKNNYISKKYNKTNINSHNSDYIIILNNIEKQLFQPLPEIFFVNNDIFKIDWWIDADVVYVASLLFSNDMMILLSKQVLNMKSNSWFITLKPLIHNIIHNNDNSNYNHNELDNTNTNSTTTNYYHNSSCCTTNNHSKVKLYSESFYKMSWQMAKVFIYHIS